MRERGGLISTRCTTPGVPSGCSVEISKASGEDVLSVPIGCVLMEKDEAYVFVAGDEAPEKTAVKLGRKAGGRVVLLEGVKAGQRVLASPPKAK